MPRIQNSIVIREDPARVFAITNDIERWPVLFNEYQGANVLKHEAAGRFTRLVFQLRNQQGNAWRSWRLMNHQELVAIAEREEPLYPFLFMHFKWTYAPAPERTLMTWTQDFELDPAFPDSLSVVIERMNVHTRDNQQRIKEIIENGQA